MRSFCYSCLKCGLFLLSFSMSLQAKEADMQHKTFSVRLKQAPLVATLQQLALEQNINLIIDDELEGTLSLQLENTNLDQLLRSVVKIKRLELWQEKDLPVMTACTEIPLGYDASGLPKGKAVSSLDALAEACVKKLYEKK